MLQSCKCYCQYDNTTLCHVKINILHTFAIQVYLNFKVIFQIAIDSFVAVSSVVKIKNIIGTLIMHKSLAKKWSAARSKTVAAGVKVGMLVSAVANSPKSIGIYAETLNELKPYFDR